MVAQAEKTSGGVVTFDVVHPAVEETVEQLTKDVTMHSIWWLDAVLYSMTIPRRWYSESTIFTMSTILV